MTAALRMIAVLGKVPWWGWVLAAILLWGWNGNRSARIERTKAAQAAQEATVARETARQLKERADETARIADARAKAAEEFAAQAARDRAAVAAAAAGADRVLKRAADLVSSARTPEGAASQPGSTAADLLGGVVASCVRAYRDLGADAVEAARAGQRCQREYDALRERGPAP